MSWEVRTMRSATSYFNFTLFRKNLSRFWPIWGLYGLLWLMLLPVNILVKGEYISRMDTRIIPLSFLTGYLSTAAALSFFDSEVPDEGRAITWSTARRSGALPQGSRCRRAPADE